MTTLKEAQQKGELEKFIKEHEKDAPANSEKLAQTLCNMSMDIRTDPKFVKKGKANPK